MGLTACQSMSDMNHTDSHGKLWNKHHEAKDALTDGQIIKVLSTANNGEIMQANAALPKLQNPQVRAYAQNMLTEHSNNDQKAQALANRLQLMAQVSNTSNALQNDSNMVVSKLNQSTTAVDKAYMKSQVMVHEKVLRTIDNQLIPNAKNPELQSMLVQTRSAVAMHLQMAKQMMSAM